MDGDKPLKNPKHEAFAQALAKGESQVGAYRIVYGQDHRGNAARLANTEHIRDRTLALMAATRHQHAKTTEQAARILKLNKQWVLDRLMRNAEECLENNSTRGAANRALELLGKELGLFVDRSEIKHTSDDLASMTDAELLAELKREAAELESMNSGSTDVTSAAQPKTIQ